MDVEPVQKTGRKFHKTTDKLDVEFDGLTSNTEYKVSVHGVAPTEPLTGKRRKLSNLTTVTFAKF